MIHFKFICFNLLSADAVVEFLNSTLYTEEEGTLDIYLLVESYGTFQVNLTVQLDYIPSELAGIYSY